MIHSRIQYTYSFLYLLLAEIYVYYGVYCGRDRHDPYPLEPHASLWGLSKNWTFSRGEPLTRLGFLAVRATIRATARAALFYNITFSFSLRLYWPLSGKYILSNYIHWPIDVPQPVCIPFEALRFDRHVFAHRHLGYPYPNMNWGDLTHAQTWPVPTRVTYI